MTEKLQDREALEPLLANGWVLLDGRDAISKTYEFKTFRRAFSWMTEAAFWAEKLNHHPEWSNVYGRVEVLLTTHDAGGLSELDIKLARRLDGLAN